MPGASPLDRLLADLAQEGRLESQGSFELDPERAVRKLALFQQAEPSQFLSLVVQAAVSSGARELQIRFSDGGSVARWQPDPSHGQRDDWKTVTERLQDAALHTLAQPADCLAAAMQAALALDPLAVGCSLVTPDGSWAVMVTEDGLGQQEGPGGELEVRFSVRPRLEGGFFQQLRQRLTGHADWHFNLVRRCGSCPIPIYVDGRRINWPLRGPSASTMTSLKTAFTGLGQLRVERFVLGGEPRGNLLLAPPVASRRAGWLDLGANLPLRRLLEGADFVTNYYRTELLQLRLAAGVPPPRAGGGPSSTLFHDQRPDPEHERWGLKVTPDRVTLNQAGGRWVDLYEYSHTVDPGFTLWGFSPLLCEALLSLDGERDAPGQLVVIQKGVALDPVQLDLGVPGALAIVAWNGPTDLSRLRPLQSEEFAQLVERCRAELASMEDDYRRVCDPDHSVRA